MSDELKPCPCCGCEAHLVQFDDAERERWSSECMNPDCWLQTRWHYSIDEAVAAWNRRRMYDEVAADVISLQADLAQIKMVLGRFNASEDVRRMREQYKALTGKEMGEWRQP